MIFLAGLVVTILAFDGVAYVVMPLDLYDFFPDYHHPLAQVGGNGRYPQDYFVAHSERGFDIGKNTSGSHFVMDVGSYKIWSNSLGCFDKNEPTTMTPGEFIYLAGDSMTWGYAPYEKKFGTLLESQLHLPVLKCGVTHSGQRHQFAKFKDITASLGRYPRVVVINVIPNDVANDYAYPHSTVVDGWLVDTAKLSRTEEIVRIDEDTLRREIQKRLARRATVGDYARAYSLSYHLLDGMVQKVTRKLRKLTGIDGKGTSAYVGGGLEPKKALQHIYGLTAVTGAIYAYNNPYAQPNKDVLVLWQAHAKQHHYRLLVSLIPAGTHVTKEYYQEFEQFLREADIPFVNFTDHILRNNLRPNSLYWVYDSHFNETGNLQYANFLSSVVQEVIVTSNGPHRSASRSARSEQISSDGNVTVGPSVSAKP